MYIPDSVDVRIAKLLGQDGSQSSEVIARQLNISSATVRRRLKNLILCKLLRIVGVVNPYHFGLPVHALIALHVAYDKLESVTDFLAKRPEIHWVSTTTGQFDIMAAVMLSSTSSLSDFLKNQLAKVEGIRDSETFICLEVKKGRMVRLI